MAEDLTPQKPEWFELVDGDAPSAEVRKVNKKLPAIAVLVTGAVIATGAFFANASESDIDDQQFTQSDFNPGNGAPALGSSDTSTPNGMTTPGGTPGAPSGPRPDGKFVPHNDGDGPDGDGDHQFGDRPRPEHEDGEDEDDHHFPGGERHERGEHEGRGSAGGSAPKIPTPATTAKSA